MRWLRAHVDGVLRSADRIEPVKFVLAPATGDPVAPVPGEIIDEGECVLLVPDEAEGALQLMVRPVELDARMDADCDRWLIYHIKARAATRWARLEILAAKRFEHVLDPDQIRTPSPFAGSEARALKGLNAQPTLAADVAAQITGTRPNQARFVGVDPWGVDVRTTLGILRVELEPPMGAIEEIDAALGAIVRGEGSGNVAAG